ncbi:MAG: glycosyl transferase family 4 [Nanoarchaeota archaeon]|nr:glycosyl transferase family 4 [Nanoarchaeota archaeon]
METILLIPVLVSFFVTLFSIPVWIKRAKRVGLEGKDIHKTSKEKIAEAGGICVLFGFVLGTLIYVQIITFYFESTDYLIKIFSLILSLLIIGFIGFIDDIFGWKIGLNKKTRIILLIFASIPLIVINAGESVMMGINFGLFYPLFLIPLGIIGAATTFNFLAGYNGLETSQGILILSALTVVVYFTGNSWLGLVSLIMVACLIAFYIFNKYPASVFPGDILTYSIGGLIAIIAILGNIEKIAVFFFIPYIIETGLKLRGGLKKESFATLNERGGLKNQYKKIYGLEHLSIYLLEKIKKDKKISEKEVVWFINLFQVFIIIIGFLIFRSNIFI